MKAVHASLLIMGFFLILFRIRPAINYPYDNASRKSSLVTHLASSNTCNFSLLCHSENGNLMVKERLLSFPFYQSHQSNKILNNPHVWIINVHFDIC